MPKFNPFAKSKKTDKAKENLASLGLDPSLFDDPVVSDEEEASDGEMDEESFINSFAPKKMPTIKPIDVSNLLNDGSDDVHVELNEEDMDENSDLSRSLAEIMNKETQNEEEDSPQKQLAALEEELLETKRAAVFFKQQGLLQEAKDQLLEIRRLNTEIQQLRDQISPPTQNVISVVPHVSESAPSVHTHSKNTSVISQYSSVPINQANAAELTPTEIPGLLLAPLTPDPVSNEPIVGSPMYLDISTFSTNPEPIQDEQQTKITETENSFKTEPIPVSVETIYTKKESLPIKNQISEETIAPGSPLAIKISEEDLEAEFMNLGTDDTEPEEDPLLVKLRECEKQKSECMDFALAYKAKNNKNSAIAWLRVAKLFDAAINLLKEGNDVDLAPIIEKRPRIETAEPSTSLNQSKNIAEPKKSSLSAPTVVHEASAAEKKRVLMFVALETKLQSQCDRWKELALSCKAAGELPMAVKYHNERKLMLEDLNKIKAGKNCKGMPVPEYSKQEYTHLKEIHFRNRIQPEELEIAIVSASNIKPPSGSITVDSYVSVSCPFAAPGDLQNWKSHKVSNTNSPVFKEIHRFKIERGKRSFAKSIERKKISFELFHTRWLRGDISLGKCDMLVADIRTKAEIKEEIPILTNGRRETGGKLLVRVRVCYPLEQKHIEQEHEDIIVITKHFPIQEYPDASEQQSAQINSQSAAPNAQNSSAPGAVEVTKKNTATVQNPKEKVVANEEVAAKKVEKQQNISVPGDGEEVDYNPIESMMSNDVLEWALEIVMKEMNACKAARKEIPEELITKQQQIELKLQLLILQIQTGKLSEEQYVQNVTDKIAEEKTLARTYMAKKNQEGARFALTRAKIMAKELEGE